MPTQSLDRKVGAFFRLKQSTGLYFLIVKVAKKCAKFVKKCLTKGDASGSICKSPDEKRRLGGRQKAQKNLKKLKKVLDKFENVC